MNISILKHIVKFNESRNLDEQIGHLLLIAREANEAASKLLAQLIEQRGNDD